MRGIRSLAAYAVLFISPVSAVPLFAADSTTPYTLLAYEEAPGAQALFSGRYGDAISAAKPKPRSPDRTVATQANLCVSYTMENRAPEAETSCSAAIRLATTYRRLPWMNSRATKSILAMMYSNRGVMRAISGSSELARKDLQKASALDKTTPTYQQNLAAFEQHLSTDGIRTVNVAPF